MTKTAPAFRLQLVNTRDGEIRFEGRILGYSSSEIEQHSHAIDKYARQGQRCSACRWVEVTIYEAQGGRADAHYCVHTTGRSVIPGEINRSRTVWTDSAYEIIELLTVRPRRDSGGRSMIPAPNARALAQAAEYDEDIAEAYVNRAVA